MRRSSEVRLRRAFADVVGAILGAAVIGGCGGSTSTTTTTDVPGGGGGGEQPTFASACVKPTLSFLAGVRAVPPLAGAKQRYETAFFAPDPSYSPGGVTGESPPESGDGWKANDGETVGTPCQGASNQAACLDKVQNYRVLPGDESACATEYPSTAYGGTRCSASYILYTRGDEIGVARTRDETLALIAPIDTLQEAVWVANQAKLNVSCSSYTKIPDSQYRTTQDGGYDLILVDDTCGQEVQEVSVHVDPAGTLTELSRKKLGVTQGCAVAGRRPDGWRARPACGSDAAGDAVGAYLASMASLEAASVVAFRRLRRQLAARGAPLELQHRARAAARDEIRHARATRRLAEKYGVVAPPPRIDPSDEHPSLFAMALENAREGCVRETFGALVAQLQMRCAADPEVRAAMAAIAEEETQHAALSWDVAEWLEAQLTDEQRAAVARERRAAVVALAREIDAPIDARVGRACGLPCAEDARAMLRALEPMLTAA